MASVTLNGVTYTDDANAATGLANGGHRVRFVPCLSDFLAEAAIQIGLAHAEVIAAQGYASSAENASGTAGGYAAAAAASALTAVNAPGTSATSTSSLAIGTGSKTLTIQTGKSLVVGQQVVIASTASPANWMAGTITAYNSGTGSLTVDVVLIRGSGTVASWTVGLCGPALDMLLKTGGTMSGAINEAPTVSLASAATVDIGAAAANSITITGTTTITALGTIAAGARRLVSFSGVLTLTHNAASLILPGAADILTAAGDSAEFLSLGSGNWKCTAYLPALGQIATQAEAEAGSVGNRLMPPNRVAQAIAALAAPASTHRVIIAGTAAVPTLPDVSKLAGIAVVAPGNAAAVPATVNTSDGWSVATGFSAGSVGVIAAQALATAHGVWLGRTMTPPVLASFTGLGTAGTYVASCQLDTNLAVVLYKASGNTTWAVAINTATNQAGTPAQLDTATPVATNVAIYADTTSSFVAFYGSGRACAGSVSGALAITPGTAVNCDNTTDVPKQLASGLYVGPGTGSSPRPITISSVTTINVGSGVSLGGSTSGARISKISATTCLIAYTSAGGGTNATRALSAVIATWNGSTLVYGTAATQASNNNQDGVLRLLQPYVDGSSWLVCVQNGTTATSGNYSGITVSGATVAIGTQTVRTNDLAPATFANRFDIYKPAQPAIRYNASTILLGHLATGPYAVTISGTTLTFGSSGGPATTVNFLTDFAGTSFYAVGASAYDKLSVSGTTITSAWQVASVPTAISSDTLQDKAVSYSGTWYTWTLPAVATLITADKWLLNTASNTTILGGPIS